MTAVAPPLSVRLLQLGRRLFTSLAAKGKARAFAYGEARRYAPTLRPSLLILLAFVFALLLAGLASYLCWRDMSAQLEQRLTLSDRVLAEVLDEIDRDLRGLPLEGFQQDGGLCTDKLRDALTRAAIESMLVREFFVGAVGSSQVCGSFGDSSVYWTLPAATNSGQPELFVLPAQSIRASVVVARRANGLVLTGVVEPRQVLDRLPQGTQEQQLRLLTRGGEVLATHRYAQDREQAFAPLTHSLASWPLLIEASMTRQSLLGALQTQLPLWTVIWFLLVGATLAAGNKLGRRQSSRAIRLQRALRRRRFSPVVQPIVDSASGKCLGAEVLMRWKHPARGLVPPAEFIDYAERSGLIVPMSDLLMRQSQRQLAEVAIAYPHLYFSFNVTPVQLRCEGFAQSLLEIFDGEPLGPSRVVLELTERDLVDEQTREELTRLRAKGFRIAIDDFGTGQSSLAILQDLPIDRLKIDRAFVNTIGANQEDQPVLDAIIGLAHRLGIAMIAEGIETPLQQRYLHKQQVQALQGYLFARPMIPDDFGTWLASNTKGQVASANTAEFNPLTVDLALVMDALEPARSELMRQRYHRLRRYRPCIVGSELVSWLSVRFNCSRLDAIKLGQRMTARGLLVHVKEEHDFLDALLFYRLVPHRAIAETLRPAPSASGNAQQWLAWLQGTHGVKPGVRYAGAWRFRNVVSGKEIVEALMRAGGLDRETASGVGVQLMRTGHLRHAFDERGFLDSDSQQYHFAR
jgi:EAL domain-containing protein (putative c-di-GMP-specific phosphodiesterase class I)